MLPLILFFVRAAISCCTRAGTQEERAAKRGVGQKCYPTSGVATTDVEPQTPTRSDDGECCGQHLVCERDTLLQTNAQIDYYDDEELDTLAGIDPADYSETQHTMLREVFDTLQERDVAGWVRSLQFRNIALPQDIREEALMIVRERRKL